MKDFEVIVDLIKKHNIKKIAEIGIWKAKTCRRVLWHVSDSIDEYWAIDQWKCLSEEYLHMSELTNEQWDKLYYEACSYMLDYSPLKVIRMESEKAVRIYPKEYFDFVYIDADHKYEATLNDIKLWLPTVKKGGILAGHDYGTGAKKGHNVKQAVDEMFDEVTLLPSSIWMVQI